MSSSKQNPSEHQPDSGSTCIEWVLQGEGNKNLVFAYKGGDLLLVSSISCLFHSTYSSHSMLAAGGHAPMFI
jgi:hypothetical protein